MLLLYPQGYFEFIQIFCKRCKLKRNYAVLRIKNARAENIEDKTIAIILKVHSRKKLTSPLAKNYM
jgi:hypothetical protein